MTLCSVIVKMSPLELRTDDLVCLMCSYGQLKLSVAAAVCVVQRENFYISLCSEMLHLLMFPYPKNCLIECRMTAPPPPPTPFFFLFIYFCLVVRLETKIQMAERYRDQQRVKSSDEIIN